MRARQHINGKRPVHQSRPAPGRRRALLPRAVRPCGLRRRRGRGLGPHASVGNHSLARAGARAGRPDGRQRLSGHDHHVATAVWWLHFYFEVFVVGVATIGAAVLSLAVASDSSNIFYERIAVVGVLLPLVELHEYFNGFSDRDLGFPLVRGDHVAAFGIRFGQGLQHDGRHLVGFLVSRAIAEPRCARSFGRRPADLRIVVPRFNDAHLHAKWRHLSRQHVGEGFDGVLAHAVRAGVGASEDSRDRSDGRDAPLRGHYGGLNALVTRYGP